MKSKISLILLILILLFSVESTKNASKTKETLSDLVLRFHIVAASNSAYDQEIKLKLRDEVLSYLSPLLDNCKTKEETIATLKSGTNDLTDLTVFINQTLKEYGVNDTALVTLSNMYFPTKVYDDMTFPCGYYDALSIIIGNGQGHNWWCVMFPRLCFYDVTMGYIPESKKEPLKKALPKKSSSITFRFYFVDLFTDLIHSLS